MFIDEPIEAAMAMDAAVFGANASWRTDMRAFSFRISVELVGSSICQTQAILPNFIVVFVALAFVESEAQI